MELEAVKLGSPWGTATAYRYRYLFLWKALAQVKGCLRADSSRIMRRASYWMETNPRAQDHNRTSRRWQFGYVNCL